MSSRRLIIQGGMARPSVSVVFRLITSSSLLDCCIARPAFTFLENWISSVSRYGETLSPDIAGCCARAAHDNADDRVFRRNRLTHRCACLSETSVAAG